MPLPGLGTAFDVWVRFGLDNAAFMNQLQAMGSRMRNVGMAMTRSLTLPILALGANMIRVAGNFEQAMNQVEAVTQGTREEMELLNSVAQELGRTTRFSASEAAEGMGFLAMAGFEVNQIAEAMPAVLNLAAAAQMDLATAADISSNIMTGYGMDVAELGNAIDVMAGAFTSANTDLSQLGEAMSFVGPIAAGLEIPFEQTAAVLGMFGNAGIQASRAGTSLRMGLLRLVDPPGDAAAALDNLGVATIDSEGNFRDLTQIMIDLSTAMDERGFTSTERLAASMQIFGVRAGAPFASVLEQGTDVLVEFADALQDVDGLAEDIAETQMQGLNGQIIKLKSAFEGLMIAIGDTGILDAFTEFAEKVTTWIAGMAEADPAMLRMGLIIAGVAAALGPLLVILGNLVLIAPAIGTAVTIMFGPWGLVIAAVVAGVALIIANWDTIGPAAQALGQEILRWFQPITDWFIENAPLIAETWNTVITAIREFWARWGPTIAAAWHFVWDGIKAAALGVWESIKTAFEIFFHVLGGTLTAQMQILNGDWAGAWETLKEMFREVITDIEQWWGRMLDNIRDALTSWRDNITNVFSTLYQTLVGGSIIPEGNQMIIDNFQGMSDEVLEIVDSMAATLGDTLNTVFAPFSPFTATAQQERTLGPSEGWGPFWDMPTAEGETPEDTISELQVQIAAMVDDLNDGILKAFDKLGKSIMSGDIAKTLERVFNDLGRIIGDHVSSMISSSIGGGGLFGSIVGAFGGGLIGGAIGWLGNELFGGDKMPGSSMANLNMTFITNFEDFFQFGTTLPQSFVLSGRAGGYNVDPHGRTLDYTEGGWESGQHFDL